MFCFKLLPILYKSMPDTFPYCSLAASYCTAVFPNCIIFCHNKSQFLSSEALIFLNSKSDSFIQQLSHRVPLFLLEKRKTTWEQTFLIKSLVKQGLMNNSKIGENRCRKTKAVCVISCECSHLCVLPFIVLSIGFGLVYVLLYLGQKVDWLAASKCYCTASV